VPLLLDTITMQLPTIHSQQARISHRQQPNCLHIPHVNQSKARRQLVIAAGEARSANRTKWTQQETTDRLGTLESNVAISSQHSVSIDTKQLTQEDKAHDLVRQVGSSS
jgi:hypothetical protein